MKREVTSCIAIAALLVASCGGGGGSNAGPAPGPVPPAATRLFADPATVALTTADVQQILAQAVAEAKARGLPGTIVVVDRVGNVLAAYQMAGANLTLSVPPSPSGINHDLQGRVVPNGAVAGAIAKAITGAYLSSSGNAFSTRTASQIVQEHFPPSAAARGLESGPLFGVQFSQLPCSDLSSRFGVGGPGPFIGPKRSPLGLSADPGGFPLYKSGVVVGGVGVMADGVYGADPEIQDIDRDDEEAIALAATQGFAATADIQADRITVDGTTLRFSDATVADLRTTGSAPPLTPADGMLIAVNGYAAAVIIPGTPYGTEASGIRPAGADFANPDAYVLTNGAGANRYPVIAGTDPSGQALSAAEVRAILEEAFKVMAAARAQIRRPLDSRAQVSISVVDVNGRVLGIVRSPDAPIFGTDVSLQKARTAAFFSANHAAAELTGNTSLMGGADVRAYVPAARAFFNDPTALTGRFAFSDRGFGNAARPYFPDGELGRPPGAFSRPIAEFNPFSTGLQSALILDQVLQHVGFILGNPPPDTAQQCTQGPNPGRLANGIQIFPGSVPIYRGNTLVGGVGVSGDGIDQDDMISFLGLHNGGLRAGTIGNAPAAIRSDQIIVPVAGAAGGGVRLRWVNCPFNPFIGTNEQNVCQGK
jgi:uncharacterized protein GlcG (DUF336 family)